MISQNVINRKLNEMQESMDKVDSIGMPEAMQALFIEYLNNYLTAEVFAERIGVSESAARELIDAGKAWHDMRVDNLKWLESKQHER